MKDTVNKPWIGVDLDGTLAYYDGWKGPDHIGKPIPRMIRLVKTLLSEGKDVRIFTARVCKGNQSNAKTSRFAIEAWCLEHIGQVLKITNEKDFDMLELYDDRCIQVVHNTGKIIRW